MTRPKPMSRRRPKTTYVDSIATVPCTMRVRKRLLSNLKRAAHARVGATRSRRARQLLAQITAEPILATLQRHSEPAPVTPMPPALPAAQPSIRVRRRQPARATLRNWGRAASRWLTRTCCRIHRCA